MLGIGLALFMIMASLIPELPMEMAPSKPDAIRFISEPPNSLLLFGWFLLPYLLFKANWIYFPFLMALVIASGILVISAIKIYAFHASITSISGDPTLFLIGLSLFTSALQPISVIVWRYYYSISPQAEPAKRMQATAPRPVPDS